MEWLLLSLLSFPLSTAWRGGQGVRTSRKRPSRSSRTRCAVARAHRVPFAPRISPASPSSIPSSTRCSKRILMHWRSPTGSTPSAKRIACQGRCADGPLLSVPARGFVAASTTRRAGVLAALLLRRVGLRLNPSAPARQHCDSAPRQVEELERPVVAGQGGFLWGKVAQARVNDE